MVITENENQPDRNGQKMTWSQKLRFYNKSLRQNADVDVIGEIESAEGEERED